MMLCYKFGKIVKTRYLLLYLLVIILEVSQRSEAHGKTQEKTRYHYGFYAVF